MKSFLFAAAAATVMAAPAFAADLPNKKEAAPAPAASTDGFDFAFGIHVMSDYISRGVSQSAGKPSVTAIFEPRYNIGDTQLYVGSQLWRTQLPTNPFAEVDLYGGIRQTWGKFTVDVGGIYYWYPGNTQQYWTAGVPAGYPGGPTPGAVTLLNPAGAGTALCNAGFCATTAKDPSWFELYVKPSYNITDAFSLGANFSWSPNWGNYKGGFNSTYLSVLPKYTFGDSGWSISGELGYQWLGTLKTGTIHVAAPAFGGLPFKYPSYWSWNVGVSYSPPQYSNVTLDLRYYGSNLSKSQCYVVSSDPAGNAPGANYTGQSNWCGQRVMATLSLDFTYGKDIKK